MAKMIRESNQQTEELPAWVQKTLQIIEVMVCGTIVAGFFFVFLAFCWRWWFGPCATSALVVKTFGFAQRNWIPVLLLFSPLALRKLHLLKRLGLAEWGERKTEERSASQPGKENPPGKKEREEV